jgi:DNA-binding response OmpR family regulator
MGKCPSVLVIEPRRNVRTTLEVTLSHEGMRVFSDSSLDSALLQLRVLQPDVIIVGSDEQELMTRVAVAQKKALSDVPLLLMGCETATMAVPGVDDTLCYPLDARDLCAKVAGSLCRSRKSLPGRPPWMQSRYSYHSSFERTFFWSLAS